MIKRLFYLLSAFLISIVLQIVSRADLIIGIAILCILFFLLVPFATFFYARVLIQKEKNKWLQSLICPVTLMLSYMILYFWERETYIYSLILLAWGEIWSLLGLIRLKHKNVDKQ